MVLALFNRELSTFSPPYDHAVPLLISDVPVSVAVDDIHWTLARIDQQTQRREIDLVRLVAFLIETPRLRLGASQRSGKRTRRLIWLLSRMMMSSSRQTIRTRSPDSAWVSRSLSEQVPRVAVEWRPKTPSRLTVVLS